MRSLARTERATTRRSWANSARSLLAGAAVFAALAAAWQATAGAQAPAPGQGKSLPQAQPVTQAQPLTQAKPLTEPLTPAQGASPGGPASQPPGEQAAQQAAPPATHQTAQPASLTGAPIAIIPIATDQAATVTGALEVTAGKAIIAASGSVTSGSRTTDVTLPRRGTLRVCAATTVKLAADTSVPAGDMPGLLMAMDHGAVEMSFATAAAERDADILLTPDFRILIGGPGASEVKVRLGRAGDTCVDNTGADAPYVVVTSLFETGLYRVQPGQRVMFEHGSLREVVDNEQEPCGCPPAPAKSNEFPLAESEGLAPTPPLPPVPSSASRNAAAPSAPPLVYSAAQQLPPALAPAEQAAAPALNSTATEAAPAAAKKKPGLFKRLGGFFKRIFGAE